MTDQFPERSRLRYPKLEHFSQPNVITTTADFVFSWARSHSVFPFTYGLAAVLVVALFLTVGWLALRAARP